jgi:uncharacterized protein involved in exopolysaccharide biosynthesis
LPTFVATIEAEHNDGRLQSHDVLLRVAILMHGPPTPGSLPKTTWVPSDIAGVVMLLQRHWRLLIACGFAGILALLAATILILGPTYVITAKILVNLGPEMAATPLLKARETGAPVTPTRRPEDSATGVEIFTDPRLIREVVAQLGDDFFADPPPVTFVQHLKHAVKATFRAARDVLRETIVAIGLRPPTTPQDRLTLAIGTALQVEPVRKTDIISVTLKFPDPRAGEMILERFIAQALSGHLQAYRSAGVTRFFQEGRAARIAELREAEDRLLKYRLSENDPVWSVAEQRPVLIRAEADRQLQLRQLRASIAASEAQVAQLEGALARLPSEIDLSTVRSRNTASDALRSRLVQLRLDLIAQQSRYGEGSQEIADIRRQIDAVLAQIGAEAPYVVDQTTVGINQLQQTLTRDLLAKRVELEGQRSSAAELEKQIQDLRGQLQRIETAAIEIGLLEQDVARLRRSLEVYEKGFEEARLSEAIEAVQFSGLRVVMPPTAEILPSSPSPFRTVLLGLAGGLMLGVGLIALREYRAAQAAPRKSTEHLVALDPPMEPRRVDTPRGVA